MGDLTEFSKTGERSIVGSIGDAAVRERAACAPSTPWCNVYRDVFGAWRWEFRDADGELRDSLDSFDTQRECLAAAKRLGLTSPDR